MPFRSIDNIKTIIEDSGLSISYLYDDLIFVKHNAYILRFDDEKPNHFFLHFNEESDEAERPNITAYLQALGKASKTEISLAESFRIVPQEDETFQVHFASLSVDGAN